MTAVGIQHEQQLKYAGNEKFISRVLKAQQIDKTVSAET